MYFEHARCARVLQNFVETNSRRRRSFKDQLFDLGPVPLRTGVLELLNLCSCKAERQLAWRLKSAHRHGKSLHQCKVNSNGTIRRKRRDFASDWTVAALMPAGQGTKAATETLQDSIDFS